MQATATEASNTKRKYDAYDASSRSVELPDALPRFFFSRDQNKGQRENIAVSGSRVFTVDDLLTKEECDFLIASLEKIGFTEHSDLAAEYPPEYRNNERLIVLAQPLADELWGRLLTHLAAKDIENVVPLGWATEGTWLPVALNECFLFSRYKEGSFFRPHFDGMYKNEYSECSIFTVTVYLNDDYEGGRLFFRAEDKEDNNKPAREIAEQLANRIKNRLGSDEDLEEKHPIVQTFTPKMGSALVFNHDTLHEGEKVVKGVKYIMRTSIMFRQVEDLRDPARPFELDELWQKTKAIFATFNQLEANKDPHAFSTKFLEAQTLQILHGRSIRGASSASKGSSEVVPLLDVLPAELLHYILEFLPAPKDLCTLMQVCSRMKSVARDGYLWRLNYTKRWGSDTLAILESNFRREVEPPPPSSRPSSNQSGEKESRQKGIIDPSLMDWCGIYRGRHTQEHRYNVPLVVYISDQMRAVSVPPTTTTTTPTTTTTTTTPSPPSPLVDTILPAFVDFTFSPWDNSFESYELINESWASFYSSVSDRCEVSFEYLMPLWRGAYYDASQASNREHLTLFVIHPLYFSDLGLIPEGIHENDYETDTKVDIPVDIFETLTKKVIRQIPELPAITYVSAELCALYSCKVSTGIVAFELHLSLQDTEEQNRVIWRVVSFDQSVSTGERTIFTSATNCDRVVDTIGQLAGDTRPVVAIAREVAFEKRPDSPDLPKIRASCADTAKQIKAKLAATGFADVRELTDEHIFEGARAYAGLPSFQEIVINTATYRANLKSKK